LGNIDAKNCDIHHIQLAQNDVGLSQLLKISIMKKNMGGLDKTIRVIIAAIIAVLFLTNVITGILGVVLLVLAGIFVLTSFISFCPLYAPFGLNTCKR